MGSNRPYIPTAPYMAAGTKVRNKTDGSLNSANSFDQAFRALTGNDPFPWQRDLFERFISKPPDNIPASCNLPTGLGKTSVVAVWLIALATNPGKIPRRLVYVVNRRTVVDQTTDEAIKLRKNAEAAGVRAPAISTLRGQFADNREWSADPSRPAIIVGTVDMIGSRLVAQRRTGHSGY
jgi:CRISPR-associated endonuclease/helicase Cas3